MEEKTQLCIESHSRNLLFYNCILAVVSSYLNTRTEWPELYIEIHFCCIAHFFFFPLKAELTFLSSRQNFTKKLLFGSRSWLVELKQSTHLGR